MQAQSLSTTTGNLMTAVAELDEQPGSGNEDEETPTLENYKSFISRFSIEAIRARLAARTKRNNNRPSDAVQAELSMINDVFRKSVLLVAWAAGLSEASVSTHV